MSKIKKEHENSLKKADPDQTDDQRTLTFIASTSSVDRSGDVINQTGWDTDEFSKSGSFLWNHNAKELPLGSPVDVSLNEDGNLEVKVRFASKEANPKAEQVYRLYKEGIMHGVSVGFLPLESDDNETTGGKNYHRQSLLELSAVPIGDNPEAVIRRAYEMEKEFGQEVERVIKSFGASLEDEEDNDDNNDEDKSSLEERVASLEEELKALKNSKENEEEKENEDPKPEKDESEEEAKSYFQSLDELGEGEEFYLPVPHYEDPDETDSQYEWIIYFEDNQ